MYFRDEQTIREGNYQARIIERELQLSSVTEVAEPAIYFIPAAKLPKKLKQKSTTELVDQF